jgi:hypothetical protein
MNDAELHFAVSVGATHTRAWRRVVHWRVRCRRIVARHDSYELEIREPCERCRAPMADIGGYCLVSIAPDRRNDHRHGAHEHDDTGVRRDVGDVQHDTSSVGTLNCDEVDHPGGGQQQAGEISDGATGDQA